MTHVQVYALIDEYKCFRAATTLILRFIGMARVVNIGRLILVCDQSSLDAVFESRHGYRCVKVSLSNYSSLRFTTALSVYSQNCFHANFETDQLHEFHMSAHKLTNVGY